MKFTEQFYNETINPLTECVESASEEIMKIYKSDNYEASNKEDGSPLTAADKRSNEIILKSLEKISPSIPIISEETFDAEMIRDLPNIYWLVDPLDGTREFINKTDEFTVNIALIEKQKTVFGIVGAPVEKKIWHGSKFHNIENDNEYPEIIRIVMSKSHKSVNDRAFLNYLSEMNIDYEILEKGSSLKLCSLAENDADVYPRFGPTSEWDIAAAHAVLRSNGGNVSILSDFSEMSYAKSSSILNPFFICTRNNALKQTFLPRIGDFFKKLV